MRIRSVILFLVLFVFIGCDSEITSGEKLIKKMYNTYEGKWFREIAFEQNSFFYKSDSIYKKQVWCEVYQFPGNLAIKFDSISSANGYLFSRDTFSIFKNGEIVSQTRRIHDLVVLSMDLYSQDVNKTINQLNELDYDLSKVHIDNWEGKEAFVVGAEKGDTTSKQFWIEKERLILVRTLSLEDGSYKETILGDYTKFNDSWIEQSVMFKIDGEVLMREEYFNIREPDEISPKHFNPNNFKNLKW